MLEQHDANLPELKKERPWYKSIHANVLQMNLRRLNEAFQNFFEQGRGYPKFKSKSKFRSFSYKPGDVQIDGNWVNFPKLGKMRFYNSRSIPDGLEIRTVTVRLKSDGWYMIVRLEDKSVPTPAAKLGAIVHEVNPRHTSQQCNCCGYVSPTNRKDEKFLCEQCGYLEDADLQASKNILERGLKSLGVDLSQLPEVATDKLRSWRHHWGCLMSLRTLSS